MQDLAKLHAKMGEPITDEEARDAVAVIGQGAAVITFDDFASVSAVCTYAFPLLWHPSRVTCADSERATHSPVHTCSTGMVRTHRFERLPMQLHLLLLPLSVRRRGSGIKRDSSS